MLSIGALSSAAQGASYYERDGYYAKDDPEHRDASAWAGKGAEELGLKGPVDADTFRQVLEGKVPDGSDTRLGRRGKDGEITTVPAATSPSRPQVGLHRRAGGRRQAHRRGPRPRRGGDARLDREERRRDRMKDPETGRIGARGQPEDRRRHLPARHLAQPRSPAPHPLCNRQHGSGGGRQVALDGQREPLCEPEADRHALPQRARGGSRDGSATASRRPMPTGASRSRACRARRSRRSRPGAPRSRRRWKSAGSAASADNPRLAERAALMTRAAKRDIDREELRGVWQKQAADLGLDPARWLRRRREFRMSPVREAGMEPAAGPGKGREPGSRRRSRNRRRRAHRGPGSRRGVTGAVAQTGRGNESGRESACGRLRRHRRPRRPWPGRWRISRSARRCSRAPTCSPPRSPMRPGP